MQIKTAEFVISSARVDQCPQSSFPEYAFIGRSNVGKSSLINMLTNHSKLAKTSATPGKTLLINHFLVNKQWYLVDLPGYGFARRSKTETENLRKMITGYILMREQMANLFLLVDSRHKPQKNDLDFIEFLGNNEIPFSIVFTKADKLSRSSLNLNVKRYLQVLEEQWEVLPPYFVTSAESKLGKEDILDYIEKINATLQNE
ncbi:MAG: YihA family ribosome biogenesis GTP-binding protein [Bacteroidaceae bacterium]|jgi:GTP-binding protein|nr:YihA family ribosome biogenesis GTP-binding protein [Bacteroidaceae bacterium]MBR4528158.1 YihA family ribosome biogenesis GTP-binding protein [Bacteroidaceae bacterium]MBR6047365.1 YihA family ribosome biogenesis GTP-binding protein [Bacteroidaceae bacterium]